jgi:hypothetical protein
VRRTANELGCTINVATQPNSGSRLSILLDAIFPQPATRRQEPVLAEAAGGYYGSAE